MVLRIAVPAWKRVVLAEASLARNSATSPASMSISASAWCTSRAVRASSVVDTAKKSPQHAAGSARPLVP